MLVGMDKDKRYYSVDSLKGIAMLSIVITHFAWSDAERMNPVFPYFIDMAVPMMMFCMAFLWSIHGDETDIYNGKIIGRKLFRILFPYLLCFIPDIFYAFKTGEAYDLISAINLFLVGGRGPGSYYVPVMVQIIFFFPIIYGIIRRYKNKGLIICLVINLLLEIYKNVLQMSEAEYRLLAFRYIFIIACGCAFECFSGSVNETWHKRSNIIAMLVMFICGTGFIVVTRYLGYEPIVLNYWTFACCIASMYIVPVVQIYIAHAPRLKVFEYIGRSSWGIFLVQKLFYKCGSLYLYDIVGSRVIQLILCIFISVMVGILFDRITSHLMKLIVQKRKNAKAV